MSPPMGFISMFFKFLITGYWRIKIWMRCCPAEGIEKFSVPAIKRMQPTLLYGNLVSPVNQRGIRRGVQVVQVGTANVWS